MTKAHSSFAHGTCAVNSLLLPYHGEHLLTGQFAKPVWTKLFPMVGRWQDALQLACARAHSRLLDQTFDLGGCVCLSGLWPLQQMAMNLNPGPSEVVGEHESPTMSTQRFLVWMLRRAPLFAWLLLLLPQDLGRRTGGDGEVYGHVSEVGQPPKCVLLASL